MYSVLPAAALVLTPSGSLRSPFPRHIILHQAHSIQTGQHMHLCHRKIPNASPVLPAAALARICWYYHRAPEPQCLTVLPVAALDECERLLLLVVIVF